MKRFLTGAIAIAFLAAAPALAQEKGGEQKAPDAENPAPPPGIPGLYDPATRTFKPLTAPQATPTKYAMFGPVIVQFQFQASSPLDWPTIGCNFEIRYAPTAPVEYGLNTLRGSQQIDPAQTPRLTMPYRFSLLTTETSPRIRVLLQCSGVNDKGVGHSVTVDQTLPLKNGPFSISATVPFP